MSHGSCVLRLEPGPKGFSCEAKGGGRVKTYFHLELQPYEVVHASAYLIIS